MTTQPQIPISGEPENICVAMMYEVGTQLRNLSVDISAVSQPLGEHVLDLAELLLAIGSIEPSLPNRLEVVVARLGDARTRARSPLRVSSMIHAVAKRVADSREP